MWFPPKGEVPTSSYVALRSKNGQRFPEIMTNATPDTINCDICYTLQGKPVHNTGLYSSLIFVPTPAELKWFIIQIRNLHLPTKQPFHPSTPVTKSGIGIGRGVRPTNTSAPSSTSTSVTDSALNKYIQPIFQHKVTRERILANNITADTPFCGDCDPHKLPPPFAISLYMMIPSLDSIILMTSLPCSSLHPPIKLPHP